MSPRAAAARDHASIWHDLECGSYTQDVAVWLELLRAAAAGATATVLDLGCGTGRLALRLAAAGHAVTGLDLDRGLVAELRARAAARDLAVEAVEADARRFDLGRQFDAVLAPMQLMQLMGSAAERQALLGCAAAHLRPGGVFAAALLSLEGEAIDADYSEPLPDMRELDGWVFSSQPLAIRTVDDGRAIVLERLRQVVSPAGAIEEQRDEVRLELLGPGRLEQEAQAAGLVVRERRRVAATEDHVGSVVVVAERPR
jgi:SAM-dependent methyltransferase